MSKRDYYEILSVSREVSSAELKASYRKLAMKYHPDKNQGDPAAEDKFKEASEAYEVLSDADKRARYDRFGHDGMRGAGGFGAGGMGGFSNVEDILSEMFGSGGAGSPFDSFFGGDKSQHRSRRRASSEAGSDIKIRLALTLEEIAHGVTKTIKLNKFTACSSCSGTGAEAGSGHQSCPHCGGQGEVRQVSRSLFGQFVNITPCQNCEGSGKIIKNKCRPCSGSGRVKEEDEIKVEIPAGVEDGNYLSMRGKGNAGRRGGANGDLIVVMEALEHDLFEREENNIIYRHTISFPDAVLGCEAEIPTLHGKQTIKIEAGTQPGSIIRLSGKGLPRLNQYGKGDQIVLLNVFVPRKISTDEKQKLKVLSQHDNFYPGEKKTNKSGFFEKVKDTFF